MAANNSNSASGGGGGELSLCLTSRQARKIVTLPSASSTKDLYDTASATFGGIEICSLKYGFPPQVMVSDSTTSLSSLVQNQERIQVEFGSSLSAGNKNPPATAKDAAAKNKSTKNASTIAASSASSTTAPADPSFSSSNGQRTSRRAAAKAARESFADVIKAQDAMIASTTTQKGRGKRKKPSSTTPAKNPKKAAPQFATDAGDGRRLADGATDTSLSSSPSKNGPSKKAATVPKPPTFAKVAGNGRRLADGATVVVPQHRNKTRQSKQQQPPDLSEALLGALSSKGNMGQVLRKGMKNAVTASYETTRAFSRLAAIQAQSYTLQVLGGGTGSSLIQVSFMGSVDKTKVQETVDLIPRTVLEAVLRGIYASNQEALRPENMSRLSPRVLWSLVQEYPTLRSVPECYTQLLPDLEWNFLQRRAPQLSEKALENLRQEQEKLKGVGSGILDLDRAAEAIQAVEHAMEHLHDYETTERKGRLARAAVARQQQQRQFFITGSADAEWKLVTPSEPDRDELLECIQSAPLTCLKENETEETLIDRLMNICHVHNWRELANVENPSQLASQLELEDNNEEEDVTPSIHQLVEQWIDYAQAKSVDEIIVEVCNGVPEHVELLTEKARSGTPKDLAAWRSIPEALHKLLFLSSSSSSLSSGDNATAQADPSATTPDITVVQLTTWCNRAHKLLQEFEWLNWYATSIE